MTDPAPLVLRQISTMDGTSITDEGTVVGEGSSMDLHDPYTPRIRSGSGVGGNRGCRSTLGNLIGSRPVRFYRFYVEVKTALGDANASFPDPANTAWGLARIDADFAGFGDGKDGNSAGLLSWDMATGHVVMDGTLVTTLSTWNAGTVAEGLFDIAAGTAAFRIKGGGDWSDPIDISSLGGTLGGRVYLFGGMQARSNFNGQWLEFNMGQSAFADNVPAGAEPGWGTPIILTGLLHWNGKRVVL